MWCLIVSNSNTCPLSYMDFFCALKSPRVRILGNLDQKTSQTYSATCRNYVLLHMILRKMVLSLWMSQLLSTCCSKVLAICTDSFSAIHRTTTWNGEQTRHKCDQYLLKITIKERKGNQNEGTARFNASWQLGFFTADR